MSFEEYLARLEEMVRCLEEGRLTLEESLRAFDEGMSLATRLGNQLKEAEQKIMMVSADAAGVPQLASAPGLKPEVTEN